MTETATKKHLSTAQKNKIRRSLKATWARKKAGLVTMPTGKTNGTGQRSRQTNDYQRGVERGRAMELRVIVENMKDLPPNTVLPVSLATLRGLIGQNN